MWGSSWRIVRKLYVWEYTPTASLSILGMRGRQPAGFWCALLELRCIAVGTNDLGKFEGPAAIQPGMLLHQARASNFNNAPASMQATPSEGYLDF
jgi:hypothetical protein